MIRDSQPPTISPTRRATLFLLVALVHLLLLYWLAMVRAASPAGLPDLPPLEVQLFRAGGGGAPAQAAEDAPTTPRASLGASALHTPPDPAPWPETLAAPPVPAPPEPLVTFAAGPELAPPVPGLVTTSAGTAGAEGGAAGGSGNGRGGGVGSGDGPGAGSGRGGSGAVLIRGPAGATITRDVSPASLASLPGPFAVLRCEIRLNQKLDRCRVLREHPEGSGAGQAALARAEEFRFRPPARAGRFRDRHRVTVGIALPPPADGSAGS